MSRHNITILCHCGRIIPDANIEYNNKLGDEGEEFYQGIAECECGKVYEWEEWGECDTLEQAKQDLKGHQDT